MAEYQTDATDEQILIRLHDNGREPYEDIAKELGIESQVVRRRVRDMKDAGIIRGFSVNTDPAALGYIPVAFGLSVRARRTDEIAEQLAESKHVYKVWILSGRHNIICHACFEDITAFQQFNHEVLQNIEGITSFESSIATRSVVDDASVILPTEYDTDIEIGD